MHRTEERPGPLELTSGRRFYVRNPENEGEFTQVDAGIDYADDEPVQSLYTAEKLRLTTMSIPRPKSTGVEVKYSDTHPVQFFYRPGPNEVTTITAPRIADDGVPESLEQPGGCTRLSQPIEGTRDGPLAQPDDLPPTTYKSLTDAWTGYKIALSRGDDADARQFACIINGIRAGRSMDPIDFTELEGFKCAPEQT